MAIKKPVVITTAKKGTNEKSFSFDKNQVRMTGNPLVDSYRKNSWEIFKATKIPTTRDEAWRRTDIRGLKINQFKLIDQDQKFEISDIPVSLLEPVADGDHGGQIVIYGNEVISKIDDELLEKGVVFCDLLTAEKNYPDLLIKAMGKIVKPEEGKFSALTGALAQNGA